MLLKLSFSWLGLQYECNVHVLVWNCHVVGGNRRCSQWGWTTSKCDVSCGLGVNCRSHHWIYTYIYKYTSMDSCLVTSGIVCWHSASCGLLFVADCELIGVPASSQVNRWICSHKDVSPIMFLAVVNDSSCEGGMHHFQADLSLTSHSRVLLIQIYIWQDTLWA